jgi:SAM-dependent methyltransferase
MNIVMNIINKYFVGPKKWYNILILFIFVMLLLFLVRFIKKRYMDEQKEGFSQNENFVLKLDNDIYDDFYVNQYETLRPPKDVLTFVIQSTMPSDDSVFLDIGSGTGYILNELNELGYNAYGIDKSKAMVEYSENKYPESTVKCGDAMDPILYDKGIFSHIICFGSTIYEIQDKRQFFQNCYFWLKPGGCLALDLYQGEPFKTSSKTGILSGVFGEPRDYTENQTNDAMIMFRDYQYRSKFVYNENCKKGVRKEKFIDIVNGNIRENEQTLYIENSRDILLIASHNGFIVHAKFYVDETKNHSVYIFERTL